MVLPPEDLPPQQAVLQIINASWLSQAVRAMSVLKLADHLPQGRCTIGELAQASGTHPPTLARLVRALAAIGLFATDDEGRVSLTPRGEVLRSDAPNSLRPYALAIHAPYVERAWENLPDAIRTGNSAFPSTHGLGFWEYLKAHPEEGALFNAAMSGGAEARARALLAVRDLSGLGTVVDVGGGQGRLLATVLSATPGLRGVLFDRPDVLSGAGEVLKAADLMDRCAVVAGDFFQSIPATGDAYVLALVIHDWADEEAIAILRACHRAMKPGARLWLIEQVVRAGDVYDRAKLLDLLMLVLFGAQERSEAQYRALLDAAGFEQIAVHESNSPFSVIEGIRS